MKTSKQAKGTGMNRRDALKVSGLALGGLALGGAMVGPGAGPAGAQSPLCSATNPCGYPVPRPKTQEYTYPTTGHLRPFTPNTPLAADEMRITFLGSAFPPSRRAQQMMSIFVEVGPWVKDDNGGPGKATDSFVFDCGVGACTNYTAMGIGYGRMDKVFISHLHADHMSDLTAIYCFGAAGDRKWPLYVFGPSQSGVVDPAGNSYDDGTNAFCTHFREAMRWHSESMSFLQTSWEDYPVPTQDSWGLPCDPDPVLNGAKNDGYSLVPIQLTWQNYGAVPGDNVAYWNKATGVKITHFPVIHCRQGSIGYKLEWTNPTVPGAPTLTMIYTSDTRPETHCITQAKNVDPITGKARGVDVFIHEMILPPDLLAMKNSGLDQPEYGNQAFENMVTYTSNIEKSSHTPQGAYGYVLSQINPRPKLAVIAHFPTANDTVACALNSVKAHFDPKGGFPQLGRDIIWATDLMVLSVKKSGITQLMGDVSDYTFTPPSNTYSPLADPKYPTPTYQLDQSTLIDSGPNTYCDDGY